MKTLKYPLLLWIALFSACSFPNQLQSTLSVQISPSPSMAIAYTPKPASSATASRPTDTAAPPSPTPSDPITPSPTSPPVDKAQQSYCDLLVDRYQPPKGFKTYCDADYGFAFNYPEDWITTFITGSSDSPGSPVQWVRKAQRFSAPGGSDYVRADTFRLGVNGLSNKVEAFNGYDERELPEKSYPSLKIGGRTAYAIINRWVQDFSAVSLFFQHGEYYTILELKAPSPSALDLNWKIAASIQVPGASPQDNLIPEELIKDSYTLTGSK